MKSKVLFEYQTSPWKGGLQLLIAAVPLSGVAALLLTEWLGAIIGVSTVLVSPSLLVYYLLTIDKSSFRIYNNRVSFFISQNGAHNIISILKIFQAQGKQVYILTRSKK